MRHKTGLSTALNQDTSIPGQFGEISNGERHVDFLLNAMPQQLWTAKPDGSLDYVNQFACDYFGETLKNVTGHGWHNYVHPDDLPSSIAAWKTAVENATEYMAEFRLLKYNGQYEWHLAKAIPYVEQGKLKLWMGTNTNIDFQKRTEQQKDEFLSIASHELKTPLTNIKAFNQLMARTADVRKIQNYIDKSSENIFRLEKLISDLLDVTKINAGKMNYNIQEFDFNQMLVNSVETIQYTALNHQIILESDIDIVYAGDRFRIEQVMNNFLSNAVKYSPAGGKVMVKAKLEFDNIIVSVQDFGIGIANQDLHRLFERYYRADNANMRFEGLGLGLFISSEILKRHHGSFWIESELGKGAVFYFRLPVLTSHQIKPNIKTDQLYEDDLITISFNSFKKYLEVDWKGFQSFESVQNGGMIMLEMLVKNNCYKILNDNRHVLGTWSEAADWAGQVWFPMMEEAGLKYFAWIYSPSVFAQLSAQKSVDVGIGNVVTQFFTDINAAENWIADK